MYEYGNQTKDDDYLLCEAPESIMTHLEVEDIKHLVEFPISAKADECKFPY